MADHESIYRGLADESTTIVGVRGAVKAFKLPECESFGGDDGVIVLAEDLWGSRTIILLTLDEARTYRAILDHAIGDE